MELTRIDFLRSMAATGMFAVGVCKTGRLFDFAGDAGTMAEQ